MSWDGSHRSPDGDCERVNGDSDNGNNEGNNDNQGDGGSQTMAVVRRWRKAKIMAVTNDGG